LFLGASALVFDGVSDPKIMESVACREGLILIDDPLLRRVRVASDCTNAVRTINGGELMGSYGQIVRKIKRLVQEFASFELVHENRRSNTDAYNLARSSIHSSIGRHVWLLNAASRGCFYEPHFMIE
jgi:hypothetical protein